MISAIWKFLVENSGYIITPIVLAVTRHFELRAKNKKTKKLIKDLEKDLADHYEKNYIKKKHTDEH